MGEAKTFDYYYGMEAEQFSFYRIPRLLIKDERFKGLSSDAKILYGLMLDRMALSMKNGWLDEENRVYIHYTIDEIMDDLGCAKEKCIKVLAEIGDKKGIGLIEKKRQGRGKPDIIYVKNFAALDIEKESKKEPENTDNTDDFSEVRKSNFKKSENRTSRSSEIELAEVRKSNPNYTNNNYTDLSDTNLIYPSGKQERSEPASNDKMDTIDETIAYRVLVRKNLDYDIHITDPYLNPSLFQEIYEIICDTVCIKRTKVRINGQDYPYETVKSKFLKLNYDHVQYVISCMEKNTVKIGNIKAYLITALYNAPLTMNNYYKQQVQHDMYGVG